MAMAGACKKNPAPKKTHQEYSREVVSVSWLAKIDACEPNRKPWKEFSLGVREWMKYAYEASGKENCVSTSGDDDSYCKGTTRQTVAVAY